MSTRVPIFLAATWISVGLVGCGSGNVDSIATPIEDGSSSSSVDGSSSTSSGSDGEVFRKEIFEKAYRAAVEFNLRDNGRLLLADELEIIEPGLKTDAERQVFKLLKFVEQSQVDRRALRVSRDAFSEVVADYKPLDQSLLNTFKQLGDVGERQIKQYEELQEIVAVHREGGAIVALTLAKTKELSELTEMLERVTEDYGFTPSKLKYVTWVPYEKSVRLIEVAATAVRKTAGEMIHNNGKVQ